MIINGMQPPMVIMMAYDFACVYLSNLNNLRSVYYGTQIFYDHNIIYISVCVYLNNLNNLGSINCNIIILQE